MMEEELTFDPNRNNLDLVTTEHYKKQMAAVRSIINLKEKGFGIREVGMKVQLADSYIDMVFKEGEEKMIEYWKRIYGMKNED